MKDFDPYHAWLGIPPREQPPHHYRLLGVDVFEPEAEVIENAAERLRSHVTRHLGGPHKAAAQKLLRELAQAGSCLLDAEAKQRYDDALRPKLKPTKPAAIPQAKSTPALPVPEPVPVTAAIAKPVVSPAPVQINRPVISKSEAPPESRPFRMPMPVWDGAEIGLVMEDAFVLAVVSRYDEQIAAAQETGNDAEQNRLKGVRFKYIAEKVTPSDVPAEMLENLIQQRAVLEQAFVAAIKQAQAAVSLLNKS